MENANSECVGPESEQAGQAASCAGCPNAAACASGANKPDPAIAEVKDRMSEVAHKILVLSGKGGVGKSTFSAQLTWLLNERQKQVGILDIDICGPSIPRMMGVENEEVRKSNFGWSPVYADDNLAVMSIGFMLGSKNDAVIWRGPRKNGLIKQFLTDVFWGPLDYLVVDAPPGTSDEHISISSYLKSSEVDGAVLITTPQEIALLDVRKELSFCKKLGIKVLGLVENMAGFVCPCCSTKSDIFPAVTGGAAALALEFGVPFLGSIPLDPNLLRACEKGMSYESYIKEEKIENPVALQPFKNVVARMFEQNPSLATQATAMES